MRHGINYGQRVVTEDGWIPINRLVDEKYRGKVLTFNHKTQRIEWHPPDSFPIFIGADERLYHLAQRHGNLTTAVNILAGHCVYVDGRAYVPAYTVQDGERLCVAQDGITGWRYGAAFYVCPIATADVGYDLTIPPHYNYFIEGILVQCTPLGTAT